ncbi:MAG: peptide deformylase [Acidobacteriota bacterium]
MAILPVMKYPNEVLTTRSVEVDTIDDDLKRLVSDMVDTMYAASGVGLAANQVGIARRLALIDLSVGEDPEQLIVMINPEIVASSGVNSEEEGCLSFPGISEIVARPDQVQMRAIDLDGKIFTLEGQGLLARAICHEVDHLDGTLFIDRLTGFKKERVRRQIRRNVDTGAWAEVYP